MWFDEKHVGDYTVRFGRRDRNAHHEFDLPVLVVCVEGLSPALLRYVADDVIDFLKENIDDIMVFGSEMFLDMLDKEEFDYIPTRSAEDFAAVFA